MMTRRAALLMRRDATVEKKNNKDEPVKALLAIGRCSSCKICIEIESEVEMWRRDSQLLFSPLVAMTAAGKTGGCVLIVCHCRTSVGWLRRL